MKFGRALAIIVHYTVQFNVECCKSSVSNMGPNTFLTIKKLSYVLKVKLQKFQTYNPYKIWYNTCYHSALHGTIQFGVLQKLCIGALILFKKLKNYYKTSLKVKLQKFQTYNPYEIWWTTCYHSALHGTIQFGVLQKPLYRTWALILIKQIIIRRLKSEITKISTYNPYEIW